MQLKSLKEQFKKEQSIEDAVVNWAKVTGIPVFKLKLDTNSGWPDRMFLLPNGRACFIEFKRPGEKPRKLQEHRAITLEQLGYNVYTAINKFAAIRWLETLYALSLPEAGNKIPSVTGLRRAVSRPRTG
jgi:hypothetical protein